MNNLPQIENVTFDELKIGQSATAARTLSTADIQLFAVLSGDVNPAHMDDSYANGCAFGGIIGHGMWSGALISALLGTTLPGPGTIYLHQDLDFKKPVRLGDTISVRVTVKEKKADKPIVIFDCLCTNALGEILVIGTATVLAPTTKIRCARPDIPDVFLCAHDRYRDLIDSCKNIPAIKTAIVHPVTAIAITAVLQAVEEDLITPVLIGPKMRILAAAKEAGVDISAYELIDTEHSNAAAEMAVKLAREAKVAAIMKGSLESDELLAPIVAATGLRTNRRISHAYLMDVPTYHKQLIITDAAINISPDMEEKADICRNAIDLWRVLANNAAEPKVAILAAAEQVRANMQATVDAACLCKMADRMQIEHALLDGPLALDLAISPAAVQNKGIKSAVAGDADILLVPDIHSGNILAKQLTFLAHADAAGIVLGARVPIILTSRADSLRTRLTSCALAVRITQAKTEGKLK